MNGKMQRKRDTGWDNMGKNAKSKNRVLIRYLEEHRGDTIDLYSILLDSGLDRYWSAKSMLCTLKGLGIEKVDKYRTDKFGASTTMYYIPEDWRMTD